MSSLTREERVVIENLSSLTRILEDNNIHFWLHAGTLLGYIRSGKKHLLTKDLDVDLLIWEESFKGLLEIVSELRERYTVQVYKDKITIEARGFNGSIGCYRAEGPLAIRYTIAIKNRFGSLLYRIILRLKRRALIHFLLWLGYVAKAVHPSKKMIDLKYFKNLKKINLFGVSINIPADTVGYLEFKYGRGWKTPIDAEDWENDTVESHYKRLETFKNLSW